MKTHFMKFIHMQQGFTMIEVLVSLLVLSLCALLCSHIALLIVNTPKQNFFMEDHTAIKQLQLIFAQGENYIVSSTNLQMLYHDKQIKLHQYQDKLIKQPGFEVILQQIDELSYAWDDSCVILYWRRKNVTEKAMLGCV